MPSVINTTPHNWYENKWPFPRPGVFARMRDMVDTAGRSYMRVSSEDAAYLDMKPSSNSTLYWVALPRSATLDDQIDVGDRLREASTPNVFRVVDLPLPWMPRRKIAIVSLRQSV